jgi:hypothetical protein
MFKMNSFFCVALFLLPALLAPVSCGGLVRTADAQTAEPPPYCCDVNEPTQSCYVAPNGRSCPNAHAAGGPPFGFFVSLEVMPESSGVGAPCDLPSGFTMGATLSTSRYQGWCFSTSSTPVYEGGSVNCVRTYATSYAVPYCDFSTLINVTAQETLPIWASYCLDPSDMSDFWDYENMPGAQPTDCNAAGTCCTTPQKFSSFPVQPFTYDSAGFSDSGCTPTICNGTCGTMPDGCGGTLNCGEPNTCAAAGASCGAIAYGCGGEQTINCGSCPGTETCQAGKCAVAPPHIPALSGPWPLVLGLAMLGVGVSAGARRLR